MILTLEEFNKIVDHISNMIEQNCSEEELDEISTSIGAGAYSTPNAFSSDKDSNGSEKLNLDPQFTFSQKPNNSKKNTVSMKEGIQTPIKPGLRLIHTLTQSELEVVSVSGNTVTMKRITAGDPKYKNIVGEKTKTSIPLLQKTDNYKVKTNESLVGRLPEKWKRAYFQIVCNDRDQLNTVLKSLKELGCNVNGLERLNKFPVNIFPNFRSKTSGWTDHSDRIGDKISYSEFRATLGYALYQKSMNESIYNVDESIAFHDKHPDLAKKYGIVGPFADPKKAAEMGKSQNKSVYTHDGKRHYLVDPKLEKDLEKAGFKKIEESGEASSQPVVFKQLPYRQNWDFPVIGKLTQNAIRQIFSKTLGSGMFGTAANNWYKQSGSDVILTIDIANAGSGVSKTKLQTIAAVMSKLAKTNITFIKLVQKRRSEDISGYEPGKFTQMPGEPGYEKRFASVTSTKAKFRISNCKIVE